MKTATKGLKDITEEIQQKNTQDELYLRELSVSNWSARISTTEEIVTNQRHKNLIPQLDLARLPIPNIVTSGGSNLVVKTSGEALSKGQKKELQMLEQIG